MLDNDEFYNFVSYLDDNTIKDFLVKDISTISILWKHFI